MRTILRSPVAQPQRLPGRLISTADIAPTTAAPRGVGAAVRRRCIEKFGAAVNATQWDYILLHGTHKKIELDLRNLFDPNLIKQSLKIISAAQCVEDLAVLKFAKLV